MLEFGPNSALGGPGEVHNGGTAIETDRESPVHDSDAYSKYQECLSNAEAGGGPPSDDEVQECYDSAYGEKKTK